MAERVDLPKTSKEVAEATYQELKADTSGFIRQVASSLESENQVLLDRNLQAAAWTAMAEHPFSAQQFLAGGFYKYTCLARELGGIGKQPPYISAETLKKTGDEIIELTIGAMDARSNDDVVARQMAMSIDRDDPEIGQVINRLLAQPRATLRIDNTYTFIQGVHTMLLTLKNIRPEETAAEEPTPIPTAESIVPRVRRPIVRSAMLEVILDQRKFIESTLDDLSKFAPRLVSKLREAKEFGMPDPDIHELFASFEMHCLMEEFSQRDLTFPKIGREHVGKKQREVMKTLESGRTGIAHELLTVLQGSILEEIETTNPDLYWGIDTFFDPLTLPGDLKAVAALTGVVVPYDAIKAALS